MDSQRVAKGPIWLASVLLMVWAAPAVAGPGDWFFPPSRLSVGGAAASEGEGTQHGLGVWARTTGTAEEAEGQFRFGERSPQTERGVAGSVHCLSRDAAGLIQVSGRIFASGGENLVGKDFAATIDVESEPQRFSDLRIGEAETLPPCGGGEPGFHAVTQGGYQADGG